VDFGSVFAAPLACMSAPPASAPASTGVMSEVSTLFSKAKPLFKRSRMAAAMVPPPMLPQAEATAPAEDDLLMDLASQLEPDGGMPGRSDSERAARSIAALLAFLAAGHSERSGAFRSHVKRLAAYLRSATGLPGTERSLADCAVALAGGGNVPDADWLAVARAHAIDWAPIRAALGGIG
jgi:hypothetical protein